MSNTYDFTVGDNGITLEATFYHPSLQGMNDLVGYTATIQIMQLQTSVMIVERVVPISYFDGINGSFSVKYQLTSQDVSSPTVGRFRVKLTDQFGYSISAPSSPSDQIILRINR